MINFSFDIRPVKALPALAAAFSLLALASLPAPLWAADTPEPTAAADRSPLTKARGHIEAKNWQAALGELKRVNARNDADWNNLMGYAMRKQARPDLPAAEAYYNEALRINPEHRDALEYSGELYLMKGELAKAEQRLATLGKACGNCEQLQDLKQATARFKAAGNRYVPE